MSSKKSKAKDFTIIVRVRSKNGTKPSVKTLCGDTIFVALTDDGQEASWHFRHGKLKVQK